MQQLVRHHSQGPQVDSGVVGDIADQLRGEVGLRKGGRKTKQKITIV